MTDQSNDIWELLEEMGKRTGHLLAQCPGCGEKCMIPYTSPKELEEKPPHCLVCQESPRVVCLSDPATVLHKKPGHPINQTLMKQFGYIQRESVPTECISIDILRPVEALPGADPASACKRWLSAHSEPPASDAGRLIDRAKGGEAV